MTIFPMTQSTNSRAEVTTASSTFQHPSSQARNGKLRQTTRAVWRGDLADSDSEYAAYFKSRGWVGSDGLISEHEKLFEFCFQAQQELTTAEAKAIELQVWVRSPHLHDYLDEVSARLAPPDPKETRTENWVPIYEQMIRRLAWDAGALDRRKCGPPSSRDLRVGPPTSRRRSVTGDKRPGQIGSMRSSTKP